MKYLIIPESQVRELEEVRKKLYEIIEDELKNPSKLFQMMHQTQKIFQVANRNWESIEK